MKSLNSTELKQFLNYAKRTAYFLDELYCGPRDPERCMAAAACLILQKWLPGDIERCEEFEREMASHPDM